MKLTKNQAVNVTELQYRVEDTLKTFRGLYVVQCPLSNLTYAVISIPSLKKSETVKIKKLIDNAKNSLIKIDQYLELVKNG